MMSTRSPAFLARSWRTVAWRSERVLQPALDRFWFSSQSSQDGIGSLLLQRRRRFSSSSNITTTESGKRFLSSQQVPLPTQLAKDTPSTRDLPPVPEYLRDEYWWAYGSPHCIRLLDHKFLVNLVLWGNFERLRDICVDELCNSDTSCIEGHTLQVACVYANFTQTLVQHLAPNSTLDVVDVIPAQLENLKLKLQHCSDTTNNNNVTLSCNDAQALQYKDGSFDQVVLFFLLHEMPTNVRRRTLKEAMRVLQPGGKLVMIDYHQPQSIQWKRIMERMFGLYEPFAMDLWEYEIQEWLPVNDGGVEFDISKEVYNDAMYQKVVVTKK